MMNYHGHSISRAIVDLFPEIGLKSKLWTRTPFSLLSSYLFPPLSSFFCSRVNLFSQVHCGRNTKYEGSFLKDMHETTRSILSMLSTGTRSQRTNFLPQR